MYAKCQQDSVEQPSELCLRWLLSTHHNSIGHLLVKVLQFVHASFIPQHCHCVTIVTLKKGDHQRIRMPY